MLKIVQRSRDLRLDLISSLRLASRQKLHMCQACKEAEPSCQLQHYRIKSPIWPFSYLTVGTRGSVKQQGQAASQLCFEKTDSSHPILILVYIPLIPTKHRELPQNFEIETLEKNKIDSSPIFTQRLFKFLYSHPFHCYILEKFITKTFSHHTHICEKAFWCLGSSQERTNFILVDAMVYSGIR